MGGMERACELGRRVLRLAPLVPLVVTVHDHVGTVACIQGQSMQPAFNSNTAEKDLLLLDRISIAARLYTRGDVVVLASPHVPNEAILKRIVGVEGDLVRSRDGDAPRALTVMSRGRISHATLDHELKAFPGAPGTICVLTNSKIIGSDVANAAREKLGVFMKMRGGMPYFRLPQSGNCWAHTKDFKVMPLSRGVCYRDFFHLPRDRFLWKLYISHEWPVPTAK